MIRFACPRCQAVLLSPIPLDDRRSGVTAIQFEIAGDAVERAGGQRRILGEADRQRQALRRPLERFKRRQGHGLGGAVELHGKPLE